MSSLGIAFLSPGHPSKVYSGIRLSVKVSNPESARNSNSTCRDY